MEDKIRQYENFRKKRDEEKEARQNRIKKRLEELRRRKDNQCLVDVTNTNRTKTLNKKIHNVKDSIKTKPVQKEKITREERTLQYEQYMKKKVKEKKLREEKIKKRLEEIKNKNNIDKNFLNHKLVNNEKIHNNANMHKKEALKIRQKKDYITLNKNVLKNITENNNKNTHNNSKPINNELKYRKTIISSKSKMEREDEIQNGIKSMSTNQAQGKPPNRNLMKSIKLQSRLLKQNDKDFNTKFSINVNKDLNNNKKLKTSCVPKTTGIIKKKALSIKKSLIRSPKRTHRHEGCFTLTQHASVFATGYTVRLKKSTKKAIKPKSPIVNLNETITLEENTDGQNFSKPIIEPEHSCGPVETQNDSIVTSLHFDDIDKENMPHSSNIMATEDIGFSSSVLNRTRLEREVDINNEINSRQLLYLCKEVQSVDLNGQGSTYCVTPVKRTTRRSTASSIKKSHEMLVDNLLRMSLQREQRLVYKNNKCIPEIDFDLNLF